MNPGLCFNKIHCDYSYTIPNFTLTSGCTAAGNEHFETYPVFMDIGLMKILHDYLYLKSRIRLGLATLFESKTGGARCGLVEKDFPCSNTGINFSLSAELTW